ncbi:hypothetical protein AB6869_21845 [Rahnella rivi]|uniref:hypothetical protein n=1 Tax=Rahnella rivi TaxID=2816249 RepID=UPI0039BEB857
MQLELFHGTRQRFTQFDTSFKGTAEAGGDIDACWFTDNFEGARNHALLQNRNAGAPLVYRCELTPGALIADHSKPLSKQPAIAERLRQYAPVGISSSLGHGRGWHVLKMPVYQTYQGKTIFQKHESFSGNEAIALYRTCGIHGVYDWEGESTDSYLRGTVTVIFDLSVLAIREVIEV